MRLLLDECMSRRLKRYFIGHETLTINEAGFKGLKNGKLLRNAGKDLDAIITVDKNIEYQHNKSKLPIAILILLARSNRYESLLPLMPKVLEILETIRIKEIIKVR
jgi:predicted nuclease of predicted toxin-antitoxin system